MGSEMPEWIVKIRSLLVAVLCLSFLPMAAEPLPSRLAGRWKITRILPTKNTPCWDASQTRPLLGSTLEYHDDAMRWRGGEVPLQGVVTRSITAAEFRKENSSLGNPPDFADLGIHTPRVTEVDLQHEDADITGATTEVPGDAVLIAGPNRIVVSACGVFFEATRAAIVEHAAAPR
jgi:hypothetical protein